MEHYFLITVILLQKIQLNSAFFFLTCGTFYISAELGDCDPAEHRLDLVSEFRFIQNQMEEMEVAIYNMWKECRYKYGSSFYKNAPPFRT